MNNIPSTSKGNSSEVILTSKNNISIEISEESTTITEPAASEKLNSDNNFNTANRTESKKRKLTVNNNVEDEIFQKKPTAVIFQNCEIHSLIINNNYCSNKNLNES